MIHPASWDILKCNYRIATLILYIIWSIIVQLVHYLRCLGKDKFQVSLIENHVSNYCILAIHFVNTWLKFFMITWKTLLFIRKISVKSYNERSWHTRRVKAMKSHNPKCWQGCGAIGALIHCWWACMIYSNNMAWTWGVGVYFQALPKGNMFKQRHVRGCS